MTSPESSIPEKCLSCPSVQLLREEIDDRKEYVEHIIDLSMSDVVERAAALIFKSIKAENPDLIIQERVTPEVIAQNLRIIRGHEIELADKVTEGYEADIVNLAKDCLGSMKLRGSRDGRQVVTAEVCMSPRLNDGDNTESVNVNRKLI